jgi:hypothetical protein
VALALLMQWLAATPCAALVDLPGTLSDYQYPPSIMPTNDWKGRGDSRWIYIATAVLMKPFSQ